MGLHNGEHLHTTGKETKTSSGTHKIKLQEMYKGIPIMDKTVVVEIDQENKFTGEISGNLLEGIEKDIHSVTPIVTVSEALQIVTIDNLDDPDLVMFDDELDIHLRIYADDQALDEIPSYLVYMLSYYVVNDKRMARPFAIIDANTGDILNTWDGLALQHLDHNKMTKVKGVGGNPLTGKYEFGPGKDFPSLQLYRVGIWCYLENQHVRVINMNHTTDIKLLLTQTVNERKVRQPDNRTHMFKCKTGTNDTTNHGYSPLNDAFFFSNVVYNMYTDWYGVEPVPGKIVARVHYGKNFLNAFWDGRNVNFGDGVEGVIYPFTVLDHVAHELTHGFIEYNANLIYSGHSGGMNEAFADMAGVAAEVYFGQTDWMHGADAIQNKNISGLQRWIDEPTRDHISIDHYDDYCPGIDVHLSSGKIAFRISHWGGSFGLERY